MFVMLTDIGGHKVVLNVFSISSCTKKIRYGNKMDTVIYLDQTYNNVYWVREEPEEVYELLRYSTGVQAPPSMNGPVELKIRNSVIPAITPQLGPLTPEG